MEAMAVFPDWVVQLSSPRSCIFDPGLALAAHALSVCSGVTSPPFTSSCAVASSRVPTRGADVALYVPVQVSNPLE